VILVISWMAMVAADNAARHHRQTRADAPLDLLFGHADETIQLIIKILKKIQVKTGYPTRAAYIAATNV
jgi:hypothetical protein